MSLFVSVGVEKTSFYFDKLFDYEVPSNLVNEIKIGCLVAVGFGKSNKLRQAVVLKISDKSTETKCKFVHSVLTKESVVSIDLLKIVKFLHRTCFCTWFEALKTVLPSGLFFKAQNVWNFKEVSGLKFSQSELHLISHLKKLSESGCGSSKINSYLNKLFLSGEKETANLLLKKGLIFKTVVFRKKIGDNRSSKLEKVVSNHLNKFDFKLTTKQVNLLNYIEKFEPVFAKKACYDCCVTRSVLKTLEKKKLIKFVNDEKLKSFGSFVKPLEDKFSVNSFLKLNANQQEVFEGLLKLISQKKACTALLRGVTGSGKTAIYVKLIEFVLKKGQQAILLVPEIALTSQIVGFFKSFFPNLVAVLHSSLTSVQQFEEYEKIRLNKARLIIGTRSAIFAPCSNLGVIIIDEEGEFSYKNSDFSPRYHARDVALFRCNEFNILLLLASATPSIETQYFAKSGKYFEFVLNKRFKNAVLPKVTLVDLKKAKRSPISGVSFYLYNELLANLSRKEQSIVLLNRRGHNSSVVCLSCGFKASCCNCSAVLTYHSANNALICHYCGHVQSVFKRCKNCASSNLVYFGQGTQKIEQEFANEFSEARVLRLDSDVIYSQADLEKKIKTFELGNYDILIGTQIVAKGLNFENVTLVGVLSVDNMLYGSDFRNSEQIFSLLTQVVGRSGRGEKLGRAIVQTYNPQNPVILKAAAQDYEKFYYDEILERKHFLCPPFCDLCVVNFSGFDREKVNGCAVEFVRVCKKMASVDVPAIILGISTPFIEKLNKRFRRRVIIKCRNGVKFRNWIRLIVNEAVLSKIFSSVRTNIDMNGEIL